MGHAGRDSKRETQRQPVADAEENTVSYSACQSAQRAVLAPKNIVGQVERAHNIEEAADEADCRKLVAID